MEPAWAYFMPLEKMLAYVDSGTTDVTISEEDQQIIDSLALPLPKAVEVAKRAPQQPCALRARQMSITASGDVTLCCSTFDQNKYKIGQYLDIPLDELQAIKYRHNTCETCMNNGLHVLFMMNDEKFEDVALANVARHYPDSKLERIKPVRVEPPRGIKAGPNKIKREARRLLELSLIHI